MCASNPLVIQRLYSRLLAMNPTGWFRTGRASHLGRRGVTAVEYGILAALLATALVAGIRPLSLGLLNAFSSIGCTLTNAGADPSC